MPSAPAPPSPAPPPMDAAAPTTSDLIVALLLAETATSPFASIDAFWPVAVVLLLILLTAATPAPETEMLLSALALTATLAAAARVSMVPCRVASMVTPPASVVTSAFFTVAATLPLISLIATLAVSETATDFPCPNEPATEAAPTSAEMVEVFLAVTARLPASTAIDVPSAANSSAVVATLMVLRAPEPPRLAESESPDPLPETPTATVTVVASISALDSARTPTAPVDRTGVPDTVARTAVPEVPMTFRAAETPKATPVDFPSAVPARVIAAAPVSATTLAASVAVTARLPTLAPPLAASPTLESVISAIVDPSTVLIASAPPPLTEAPSPFEEICAPTAAAMVCAKMSALRFAATVTSPRVARLATCVIRAATSLVIELSASDRAMARVDFEAVLLASALRLAERPRATEVARMTAVSLAETLIPPVPEVTASSLLPVPSMTAEAEVTTLLRTNRPPPDSATLPSVLEPPELPPVETPTAMAVARVRASIRPPESASTDTRRPAFSRDFVTFALTSSERALSAARLPVGSVGIRLRL